MEKKYRIAVVGCGAVSHHWLRYVTTRDDIEIVSLVDPNKANAEDKKSRYGLHCPIYSDLTTALKETSPNLLFDLTYVTTHVDIVTQALKAGCNVFGEKPMALTREQAEKMVLTARETKKTYSVLQNRRYVKGLRALKEIVASGVIGKPGFVCADIFTGEWVETSIRNQLKKTHAHG